LSRGGTEKPNSRAKSKALHFSSNLFSESAAAESTASQDKRSSSEFVYRA
jgi:hypothetical protein